MSKGRNKYIPKELGTKQLWKPSGPGTAADFKEINPWNGAGFHACFELENIDLNSKIGRSMIALKNYLREYVVQNNILSELLIGRITYKVLKLVMYESACLKNPQNTEAPHYLPMTNSLRLDLRSLADLAGETKPPDLSDYLAMKNAKEVKDESTKMKRQK